MVRLEVGNRKVCFRSAAMKNSVCACFVFRLAKTRIVRKEMHAERAGSPWREHYGDGVS